MQDIQRETFAVDDPIMQRPVSELCCQGDSVVTFEDCTV